VGGPVDTLSKRSTAVTLYKQLHAETAGNIGYTETQFSAEKSRCRLVICQASLQMINGETL